MHVITAMYHDWFKGMIRMSEIPDPQLHVLAGIAIMLVARVLFRRPFASLHVFGSVIALAVLNECMDRLTFGSWRWLDTRNDIADTLAVPLLIVAMSFAAQQVEAFRARRHVSA